MSLAGCSFSGSSGQTSTQAESSDPRSLYAWLRHVPSVASGQTLELYTHWTRDPSSASRVGMVPNAHVTSILLQGDEGVRSSPAMPVRFVAPLFRGQADDDRYYGAPFALVRSRETGAMESIYVYAADGPFVSFGGEMRCESKSGCEGFDLARGGLPGVISLPMDFAVRCEGAFDSQAGEAWSELDCTGRVSSNDRIADLTFAGEFASSAPSTDVFVTRVDATTLEHGGPHRWQYDTLRGGSADAQTVSLQWAKKPHAARVHDDVHFLAGYSLSFDERSPGYSVRAPLLEILAAKTQVARVDGNVVGNRGGPLTASDASGSIVLGSGPKDVSFKHDLEFTEQWSDKGSQRRRWYVIQGTSTLVDEEGVFPDFNAAVTWYAAELVRVGYRFHME